MISRLEQAYKMPPSDTKSHLVQVDETNRGVDFGFRDAIYITGKLCYASLLKYQAAIQMAYLFTKMGNKSKALVYQQEANLLKRSIISTFIDARGMLRASTGISAQADVWATSLAINLGVLTGQSRLKAAQYLRDAYVKGELSQKGNIRHVVQSDDFSATSAWEKSVVPINTYQNGAYWGTPVGWVCQAIAYVDLPSAQKLAKEFIQELLDPKTQNEAFQKLLHTYQRPLYHHIRNIVLNHDDTDDVLQNLLDILGGKLKYAQNI